MSQKKFPIGILGGGQLARMMALKAHDQNLKVAILSPSEEDPAAQVTPYWIKGDPNHLNDLKSFFQKVQTVTFESEFANISLIKKAKTSLKTKFYPHLDIMQALQDRWTQKQLLDDYDLLTSPFLKVDTKEQAQQCLQFFNGSPFVFKKRTFGYDGYGTFVIQSESDFKQCLKKQDDLHHLNFIAEAYIPFKRELSIMAFRNIKGDIIFYPLVESYQKNSKCLWVMGPVFHINEKPLKTRIKKLLNETNYVGAIAFELFEHKKELWINEVAPRVHNTAHYSMDAFVEDQFSLHLHCILNKSLKKLHHSPPGFAMYNLIGTNKKIPKWELPTGVRLHWYGKSQNRPGRKMGHLNTVDDTPNKALQRIKKASKEFQL